MSRETDSPLKQGAAEKQMVVNMSILKIVISPTVQVATAQILEKAGMPSEIIAFAPSVLAETVKNAPEFWNKLMPKQQERLEISSTHVIKSIKDRLEKGDELRDDGFFKPHTLRRSDAASIIELLIYKVMDETDEEKIPYISNILVNTAFDSNISSGVARKLLNDATHFSYRQLCILAMVGTRTNLPPTEPVQEGHLWSDIGKGTPTISNTEFSQDDVLLVHECQELIDMNYLQTAPTIPRSLLDVKFAMTITNIGIMMQNHMNLGSMDSDEIDPIAKKLGWSKTEHDTGIAYNPE